MLEIGILDSLLRQCNGSEDFNILTRSKVLLKIAIVFKISDICAFLSLTVITDQGSISSLADGLLDITPETRNAFEHFHCEI